MEIRYTIKDVMATKLMGIEHSIYRSDGKVHLYRVGGGAPILFIHGVGGHGHFGGADQFLNPSHRRYTTTRNTSYDPAP